MNESGKTREKAKSAGKLMLAGIIGATCLTSCVGGSTRPAPANSPSSTPNSTAQGTVICPAGEPVTGIWIDSGSGSGWAQWRLKDPQNPNVAEYSREVGGPTTYGVHVGCDGTPAKWEHANYAQQSAATDIPVVWQCGPNQEQPLAVHGVCLLINRPSPPLTPSPSSTTTR